MKYAINAPEAPEAIGPYSQGTTAGRLVFASGQLPIDKAHPHHLVAGGIKEQTVQVIHNCAVLLEATGCTLDDVAQTNVYLADIALLDEVNAVYEQYFTMPAPARTVVAVDGLPMGALIEMDCVACR
ncbi:MAG: RidA family protein [Atopobiaceae bacterium]|nr:RidA family protein [Atopobiaceae bacterium]